MTKKLAKGRADLVKKQEKVAHNWMVVVKHVCVYTKELGKIKGAADKVNLYLIFHQ